MHESTILEPINAVNPRLLLGSALLALPFLTACVLEPASAPNLDTLRKTPVGHEGAAPTPAYPVDPQVHAEGPSYDVMNPGSTRPKILNPVAYARYALAMLGEDKTGHMEEAAQMAHGLAAVAAQASVSPQLALAAFQQRAPARDTEDHWKAASADARGAPQDPPRIVQRISHMRAHLQACLQEAHSTEACCASLAPLASMLPPWPELDSERRAHFRALAEMGADFYAEIANEALARSGTQPFSHLGIRAWLALCAPPLGRAPNTLQQLRQELGAYDASPDWEVELHPISMAKLAGRRIYRRLPRAGQRRSVVSVAESLDAECGVRETEVIRQRENGTLDFWSYDAHGQRSEYGLFPARPGVDAIKATPDSCMGCHYTFDTRRFRVPLPSYQALHLQLRFMSGLPHFRDDAHCHVPGERVVWHESPPDAPPS